MKNQRKSMRETVNSFNSDENYYENENDLKEI